MSQVSIHTYVDLDEVFSDISTDDLVKELARRRSRAAQLAADKFKPLAEVLDELEWSIRAADNIEALRIVDHVRAMNSDEELAQIYAKACEHRDPETGRPVIQ